MDAKEILSQRALKSSVTLLREPEVVPEAMSEIKAMPSAGMVMVACRRFLQLWRQVSQKLQPLCKSTP
ncbi:hypothetical protein NKI88_22475 [Mesorhizobium sp. M0317]|uniref:hypothetical protein n=1 Tax=Mesorhizobium sp. M0317 TaxID=2956935 RepID=UPI00333BE3C8